MLTFACASAGACYRFSVRPLAHAAPPTRTKLALVGVVSLALGVVCVRATIGEPPPGSQGVMASGMGTGEARTAEPAGTPDEDPAMLDEAPESEPLDEALSEPLDEAEDEPLVAAPDDELSVDSEPAEESDPAPPPTPADFRFRRGRLAYLRCVGLEGPGGRCPRDTALEEAAWSILETTGACSGVVAGSADVRLHMSPAGTELGFRDFGARPIAAGVLAACLEPRMAGLRTDLQSGDVIVSFRFEIRR